MTLEDGIDKITHCSLGLQCPQPAFPLVLRKAGRFIIKEGDDFAYMSELKSKTFTINGAVTGTDSLNVAGEIDASPTLTEYAQGDLIPQDVINEYNDIDELQIYGLLVSFTGTMSTADVRMLATSIRHWISMQPMSSWNDEDACVITGTFNSTPGIFDVNSGLRSTTTQKVTHPFFIPIKQNDPIRKNIDKFYLYLRQSAHMVYLNGVTSISGNIVTSVRIVLGRGYLAETIEELLSVQQ